LPDNVKFVKSGKAGKYVLKVFSDDHEFYAEISKERRNELYHFHDLDRLVIYVEMLRGKVLWD